MCCSVLHLSFLIASFARMTLGSIECSLPCCRPLQPRYCSCIAVCCNVLHCNTLQHHCNTIATPPQHHCNALQHTATHQHRNATQPTLFAADSEAASARVAVRCSLMQCAAVCCSVLQCAAVCCRGRGHTSTCKEARTKSATPSQGLTYMKM